MDSDFFFFFCLSVLHHDDIFMQNPIVLNQAGNFFKTLLVT